ncbi:MAG: DUF262 domain-containing protein [Thalassospira sp.]|uniref:DUF262 domain-containing protein n=1 Tax=Thalassospira sp. TaxID=1912094 RepID=UPI0032EAB52D
MSFHTPDTIAKTISSIHSKQYLLPAIQREFVWSSNQIETLFDSLMRGYPIGTFLFWKVQKKDIKKYQFYEFIREYHQRDNIHNETADTKGESSITAILDGQQRLTGLYIGLKGSYSYKQKNKRWNNDSAFPKRKLFLNLTSFSSKNGFKYEFSFLSESERRKEDIKKHWFEVGEILNLKNPEEIQQYIEQNLPNKNNDKSIPLSILQSLYECINESKEINYFLEEESDLDKVLNIFIRLNSGGTALSYSDLLLSISTATWKKRNARQEITSVVDRCNKVGNEFNINKDFILKSCLYLTDSRDISFKIKNFNRKKMNEIEEQWDLITKCILNSINLVSSFGYNRDTLTANNALLPISYFLYQAGNPRNFVDSSKYKKQRSTILEWISIALVKKIFSGQPDSVLKPIREEIIKSKEDFPLEQIKHRLKRTNRSMQFSEDDLNNLLYLQYKDSHTFSILSLIYPTLDFRNKFHLDHIHPQQSFKRSALKGLDLSEEEITNYMDWQNYIANLQLLAGSENQQKSGKHFERWLDSEYPNKEAKSSYMKTHHIPNTDLSLTNFETFIDEREKLLLKAFRKRLPLS